MTGFQSNLAHFDDGDGPLDGDQPNDVEKDDGHIYEVSELSGYWKGTEEACVHWKDRWDVFSLVPAGRVMVILDDSSDVIRHGWPSDTPVQTGVYIAGRDNVTELPPTPVAVDDDYLKFAADACLRAANGLCGDKEIAAVCKSSRQATLTVYVREDEEKTLFAGTEETFPEEQPDLYRGFFQITQRTTPTEIYTDCEFPRLDLTDLDYLSGVQ